MKVKALSKAKIDVDKTSYPILLAICSAHLINDLLQSILPSIYPLIQEDYSLSFSQIGMITFTFQITASLLQPFVGFYTDKKPQPYSFVFGMILTLIGIVLLSFSSSFYSILLAAGIVGLGSSVFHPEASKLAYFASGGKRGLAQSIFQLGGNTGSAIGPLLVALIVAVHGQRHILWFLIASFIGIFILLKVGKWYVRFLHWRANSPQKKVEEKHNLPRKKVITSIVILLVLIFSKFFYTASMTNYFTFYLIDKFDVTVQQSQFYLFIFLISVAAGTLLGGPIGDRYGRKLVIKFSILGVAPFTLMLPHVDFEMTIFLAVIIGLILSSAFSAIIVYAQELLPGRIGMVSGLFFGFGFGMGGLGSALLGRLADATSIGYVFQVCSFLPLIGLFVYFLPTIDKKKANKSVIQDEFKT